MADPQQYTVGWICALPLEFDAAQALLDEEHDDIPAVAQHDNNSYALGRIGKHNVVIAVLPDGEYGLSSATAVARDLLHSFPNVRIGLMVGIGGGAPSPKHDIRLGDVVVSSRDGGKGGVFQYDYGKAVQNKEVSFEHTDFLDQPPMALRTAVAGLKSKHKRKGHQLNTSIEEALRKWPRLRSEYSRPPLDSDRLYSSDVVHPDSSDECAAVCSSDPKHLVVRPERGEHQDNPAIHYGLIASANQLMKDVQIRDQLASERGVLCFEMEAAGLMNHFPCLVIRGICDYADSHKNKVWQGYAAMVAAAYAKELLQQIPASKVEAERPIAETLGAIHCTLDRVEQTTSATQATVDHIKSSHHIDKIERWLQPPDPSTNANQARKLRHKGTGAWLLAHPVFQSWHSRSRRHLWLHGFAGCGKTVLSTTVLDHVAVDNDRLLVSFFFDFRDTTKQTVDGMLRSLAFQLYQSGAGSSFLDASFKAHQDGRQQPGTKTLEDLLITMLAVHLKVFVVLDALDESTTRRDLLSWIKDINSRTTLRHVQLICTSRSEGEFLREIPATIGGDSQMRLDKQAMMNHDISCYVSAQLSIRQEFTEKRLSQDLLELIRNKVGGGADGMFRWAACQLDSLARRWSPKAVKDALDHLPEDLNETYERMLCNVPKDARNSATRLFHFLVYCDRPVTVPEAIDIIATDTEAEPPSFDVNGRVFGDEDVLRHGPSLISIVEVMQRNGRVRKELHLAHFSVKEFLQRRADFQKSRASIIITKTSLTYLSDITVAHKEIRRSFPLARLAAEIWTKHGASAENCKDTFRRMLKFLEDKNSFRRWVRLYQAGKAWPGHLGPSRESRLYYACLCGIVGVAGELIEKGADANARGGNYGTALQAASERGYTEIVQLLLEKGADVNAQAGRYGDALQAASERGYTEIVQMLLEKGADVNTQAGDFGNALYAASEGGHDEVVKMLLAEGSDVNAQGGRYGNALQAASERGYTEIVQLLLKNGAGVNAQGGFHGNALHAASQRGHVEIVQLLLQGGADVNAQAGKYGNALQAASEQGHTEIVQLLLEKGADVNAQAGIYGNALEAASERGYAEIVQLLLEKGAEVNARGSNYGTALEAASLRGHVEIVQLLLKKGADVNAQTSKYGNVLQPVSEEGHVEIVRLLLEKGADVNAQGGFYGNALQAASSGGHVETVQLLLERGAEVNARGGTYGTALVAASLRGLVEIVQLLLEKGADVNIEAGGYGNALYGASERGYVEIVQLLLEKGADINTQGGYYGSALQAASEQGNVEIVQLLLEKGADIHAQGGEYGHTALSMGCRDRI